MGTIFTSPGRTVVAGIVLLILIVVGAGLATGQLAKFDHAYATVLMRWLHVVSGVLWVGLLWYLNFVQVPTMPSIQPVESRTAITRFITPKVLLFFRHAALATVVTGLLLALMQRYLLSALTLQPGFVMIGIGMWMALIMAFNVWFIIWPNQRKILGLVEATAEEKAAAAKPALYASRFNTMFSIGMLYCMVAQQNAPL
ncbi:MAG: urate hydroxylase PuuD [Pseudomonadota bacterium]